MTDLKLRLHWLKLMTLKILEWDFTKLCSEAIMMTY